MSDFAKVIKNLWMNRDCGDNDDTLNFMDNQKRKGRFPKQATTHATNGRKTLNNLS